MKYTSKLKVLAAGFMIIRTRNIHPISDVDPRGFEIWGMTKAKPNWHKLEGAFKTKAAR